MECVKRAVEGGANLYLHFSVICKVLNVKNDFALKASKHQQFSNMKKLELHLLVQFAFLFRHLNGRSLLKGAGIAWQWSSDQEAQPLCSCVGNTLFHHCGFLFVHLHVGLFLLFCCLFFLLLGHGILGT